MEKKELPSAEVFKIGYRWSYIIEQRGKDPVIPDDDAGYATADICVAEAYAKLKELGIAIRVTHNNVEYLTTGLPKAEVYTKDDKWWYVITLPSGELLESPEGYVSESEAIVQVRNKIDRLGLDIDEIGSSSGDDAIPSLFRLPGALRIVTCTKCELSSNLHSIRDTDIHRTADGDQMLISCVRCKSKELHDLKVARDHGLAAESTVRGEDTSDKGNPDWQWRRCPTKEDADGVDRVLVHRGNVTHFLPWKNVRTGEFWLDPELTARWDILCDIPTPEECGAGRYAADEADADAISEIIDQGDRTKDCMLNHVALQFVLYLQSVMVQNRLTVGELAKKVNVTEDHMVNILTLKHWDFMLSEITGIAWHLGHEITMTMSGHDVTDAKEGSECKQG